MTERLRAALQELVTLLDIKERYAAARPDSPRHPQWQQYLDDTQGFPDRWIHALANARAALASPDMEQRAGWMPIDTAPKDDGVMLAVRSNFGLYVFLHGHWLGDFWVGLNADLAVQRVEPTHWMPLPAPPIEALEGGKTDLGASGALGASSDNGAQT